MFALVRRQLAIVRIVERKALELVLVDGSDQFGINWGQDWLLLRELWVEVQNVLFVFLKGKGILLGNLGRPCSLVFVEQE